MPVPEKKPITPTQVEVEPDALVAMGRNPSAATLGQQAFLQMPPGPGVLMRHHPANWEVGEIDGKPYWLPEISAQPKVAGTPGVKVLNQGEPPDAAWANAVFNGQRKGWVYIDMTRPVPVSCLPAGMPAGALPMREYDCHDPKTGRKGVCHVEVWKLPRPSLPDERQRFYFDRESYNKWRLHLVETGVIRPPLPHVLAAKIEGRRQRIDNVSTAMAIEVRERLLKRPTAEYEQHKAATVPAARAA